ncbi:hypothetical protein BGX28_000369 [Mortierella sp. GBA30]|nr:hypothetical protein BGX28_000369 [Mortierella sp. GBA30]
MASSSSVNDSNRKGRGGLDNGGESIENDGFMPETQAFPLFVITASSDPDKEHMDNTTEGGALGEIGNDATGAATVEEGADTPVEDDADTGIAILAGSCLTLAFSQSKVSTAAGILGKGKTEAVTDEAVTIAVDVAAMTLKTNRNRSS